MASPSLRRRRSLGAGSPMRVPCVLRRRARDNESELDITDCWSQDAFVAEAAQYVASSLQKAQAADPYKKVLLGLSGGSTPKKILPEIASVAAAVDWSRVIFFLVDERYISPDHEHSNQKLIRDYLLSTLPGENVPEENIIFPDTTLPIEECISHYSERLRECIYHYGAPDVLTLGVGEDGHIASWFPTLSEEDYARAVDPMQLVSHTQTDQFDVKERITISLDLVKAAKVKIFFLQGEKKLQVWREMCESSNSMRYPGLQALAQGLTTVICHPPLDENEVKEQSHWKDEHLSVIVLGASGDLAKKKTFPALFTLFSEGRLPQHFNITGYARSEKKFEDFWKDIETHLRKVSKVQCARVEGHACTVSELQRLPNKFKQRISYNRGSYDKVEDFKELSKKLEEEEKGCKRANRLFYMALPPSAFGGAVSAFREGCWSSTGWNRVIVEKPFGHDLESSNKLTNQIRQYLSEEQIYRIDHYLGKEMVLNLLALRFANVSFTPVWNRSYVDNIRITLKEPFGTEGRGGFFDDVGILRDVMQNHLLQVLCLVAMERPASLTDEDIRDEKVKVLRQTDCIQAENVVLGQYTKSVSGEKPGYTDDDGVDDKSQCATFATCVMFVNNERWAGVPFIMKAGKALDAHMSEVRIQLKDVPGSLFGDLSRNEFVIKIQPNESVYLKIYAKKPGLTRALVQAELDLSLHNRFEIDQLPDAYERLILDCLNGEKQNFVRTDELAEAWRIFTPVLHAIDAKKLPLHKYPFGSRGPPESDELISKWGYKQGAGYEWKPSGKI